MFNEPNETVDRSSSSTLTREISRAVPLIRRCGVIATPFGPMASLRIGNVLFLPPRASATPSVS